MVTRERHRDRGVRRVRSSLTEIGRELRGARRSLGLRQVDVGQAAGISRSWVSKIELGLAPDGGLRDLSVMAAVLGST
jgi:transcriptional regulator with XRE-family HTH domain